MDILERLNEARGRFEHLKILAYQKQNELNEIFNQMKIIQGEYQALNRLAEDNNLIVESHNQYNEEFTEGPVSADKE